jgi:hypothetical protein
VVFTILGLIVLASIPKLRLTITNLFLFVMGAFPGTLTFGYLYGRIFADSANELNGRVAVLGIFAVMLIGAVVGGVMVVWCKTRFVPADGTPREL